MSKLERIVFDPEVCGGSPVIRGSRYPVELLLDLLAAGLPVTEILDDHPELTADDLLAVIEYGVVGAYRRSLVRH
ncbi:DUF433 domain-containing protein [Nocardia huaxiensis]|uniref:DUF433 domain-containing protein n=1 Tax=Nocardia huaxiensis TaxID=2755382 RepID=A0A7D6ZND8_9NOCA|nr:DUF433 domain-containing protein [Nocardia huaxiensis]QLY31483.1 DUF433 domain-containing protein [Nocardia huaxiensis]UFS95034.1 DUF433 domain-containing protein [Nocardia huaxiensis]